MNRYTEHNGTRYLTNDEIDARIQRFTDTYVSKYVLPGKVEAAEKRRAANVTVPVKDMVRLLARLGEEIEAADKVVEPQEPSRILAVPGEIAALMDWDAEGCAIVTRGQVEALILQAARIGYATPRAVVKRKSGGGIVETVTAAHHAGKASVSVPVTVLRALLGRVEAQRIQARELVAA